ncbi:PREDICTED: intraflagellar transport protein 81 homolog [Dufourea novaeangliae]|uniref:Intraflagellar transport protein 81 like protein n=1 Tax=Dufourea novaeangliae TaxID=178035 RepID=A0A154PIQ8_DUFNO|nr:PREDICTED: intraflagellar transport protein 81 homolog [Dufourea novaeangliae]KZC11374.1 Intraflagellar transport protein 81 like protein [Dufourea novaeangliae]
MKENMKFIVTEVNRLLGRNYNMIYFNSLTPEELLQVLREVLIKIQDQNDTNVDSRNETPEEMAVYILSVLRVLNYQPQTDPVSFRQGLIRGDPETIHPILTWLLSHVDIVRKRAYLSRFLVKVEVPDEYLSDPEVSSLYEQYTALIDRFKSVHKESEIGKRNFENASELTADLKTMEKEKEAVTIRIEKMKAKAETGIHLLEAARALRLERDKERDLALQEEQEHEILSRLQIARQRLERELETLKKDENEVTPQSLVQQLSEAMTVQTIVANEKLPAELNAKKNRLKALNAVRQSSYLGPEQITAMRNKLDGIAKEIQDLMEIKISRSNIDKMEPFRQQAAAVANMKRNVLDRLEKTESSLQELRLRLEEKRELSKMMVEYAAPKGDELKKYVNRLKTRSTLYKHCKGELAWLNAENSVLYRTTAILENQLNQCNQTKEMLEIVKKSTTANLTEENPSSMNLRLSRDITDRRGKLVPLIKEVQLLREKSREFEQKHEKAEKAHNDVESTMNVSINSLQSEIESVKTEIAKCIEEKERLERHVTRMKTTQARIKHDTEDPNVPDPGAKIKEELNSDIRTEESKIKSSTLEKEELMKTSAVQEKQMRMWNDILLIFKSKIKCAEQSKQSNGIVVRQGGAETLVLQ